jgi:hypothetical protein
VGAQFVRAFALAKAKQKKSVKKNKREKSERVERERKKHEFALFPPVVAHHWKPGSRAQSHSERESKGLE